MRWKSKSQGKFGRNISRRLLRGDDASQIIEFAVLLPLVLVLVVGVYDFGGAFILKHKIGSATLEGVRFASNQPSSDLSAAVGCGAPATICAVRDVVHTTLINNRVNDCGLASATAAPAGSLTWTFTVTCPGNLILKIERGVNNINAALPTPFQPGYLIEATRVTLTYPYHWHFDKVIPLLMPGASYPAGSPITTVVVMQNLN
jgi:Flp pilus assembly protein TadG